MAELHVQPKKSSNWALWVLLALAAILIVIFLMRGCGVNTTRDAAIPDSSGTGAVVTTTPGSGAKGSGGDVDFGSPALSYEELTDKDISVRGKDGYAIYSLGDNVLFDVDKSNIRPDAETKLKQVIASLDKRFPGADISIYGHTDATGDAVHNKELSQQRAEAVKQWIIQNSSIKENVISIHSEGENNPVASNATEQGKQENRNVMIVARPR